jgi:uncharacterized membrane protein SirB2
VNYLLLNIHFILGLLALFLYILRGAFMLTNNLSRPLLSLASVLSILFFGTGLALVFLSSSMTFANGWVMTKMLGTLFFVFFGIMAFKEGVSKPRAIVLWLLGLAAFAYTFAIAKGLINPIGYG